MLFDKYKFKLDKYIFENWTFRIVTLVLAGIIVFEGYLLSEKVNSERVVVLPPKISKPFWVAGNKVSASYLQQMGNFIAFYLFDISPDTAKNSIDNILIYVEPQFYAVVKKALYQQMNYIIANDISRAFYPSVIKTNTPGIIKVIGILRDTIGNKVVNQKQIELDIGYEIKQGRFWITSLVVKDVK